MRREANHIRHRQPKSQTDRAKSAEGRTASASEKVANGAFVNPGPPAEVAAGPSAQNVRPIDGYHVDRPPSRRSQRDACSDALRDRNGMHGLATATAMEGTVVRVPCKPSRRQRGFWRSSVRSAGPPRLNLSSSCHPLAAAARALSDGCASLMAPPSL